MSEEHLSFSLNECEVFAIKKWEKKHKINRTLKLLNKWI